MKQVIIILLIILLLYIIYRCINCSKTEGFVDRNRKNKVIDLIKGVNSEGDRRNMISEGISLDDDLELICIYNNKNIFETKLEVDEYILGSIIYENDFDTLKKDKLENPDDNFPHKLNYVYNSANKKIDYFKTEKDLKAHKDIITIIIQNNNIGSGSKDGDIVSKYLKNNNINIDSYKKITIEPTREFNLLELLGFEDPNIKNKTDMDKYISQKFYKYNDTSEFILDENKKKVLYNKVISEIKDNVDSIHGGNNKNIPFYKKGQLYSFLNKCRVEIESIETINLLDSKELQLNIYGFKSKNTPMDTIKCKITYDKKTQIDLLYELLNFQVKYLYQNKDYNKIVSQYPNINTDVNLYYHYYDDEIKNQKIEDKEILDENKTFRYLGGLVSQNKILNKYEKLKILKIPQRCLKVRNESYTEFGTFEIFDKERKILARKILAIHPIYKTIVNVKSLKDPVYELKPCIQLHTKFRQQQKYYNDIKGKCKQYSKVNVENPIFTKSSESVNSKIKHDIIKRNSYIINEKKKALEELKKEDIIKKNINRAYNRGKLNKYLNNKEENLYMLNKKINDSKNSIDLNFYYSGDILNDCFNNFKDSSLSKEDKISKCNTIIQNNLDKQKKEQEKEILTTCKQTDFIRKDEVPCWGCTDIVMN